MSKHCTAFFFKVKTIDLCFGGTLCSHNLKMADTWALKTCTCLGTTIDRSTPSYSITGMFYRRTVSTLYILQGKKILDKLNQRTVRVQYERIGTHTYQDRTTQPVSYPYYCYSPQPTFPPQYSNLFLAVIQPYPTQSSLPTVPLLQSSTSVSAPGQESR